MTGRARRSGDEPGEPLTDRLFYAIRPPGAVAASIEALGQSLKATLGLKGRLIPVDRLHVTVKFFGGHAGLPSELVRTLSGVASELRAEPFDVCFDHVMTFEARGRRHPPFVLRGSDEGLERLRELRAALDDGLSRRGISSPADMPFAPHVTLMYADRPVVEQAVPTISWRVEEVLLVDSLIGQGRHAVIGRWPLALP